MTKTELFIELANPDQDGVSRWVKTTEFVGNYSALKLGNGGSWCRSNSPLAKKYIIETDKKLTPGNSIDAIRLNGFKKTDTFSQTIRKDIKDFYKSQRCVMLGVKGFSENTKIEIDHKDGRKDDWRVSDIKSQRLEDFQPLCKAANDVKRQICKTCKESNERWDATNIKGNPYPFYQGDKSYTAACARTETSSAEPRNSLISRDSAVLQFFVEEMMEISTENVKRIVPELAA